MISSGSRIALAQKYQGYTFPAKCITSTLVKEDEEKPNE
jgi:hypothetical protein